MDGALQSPNTAVLNGALPACKTIDTLIVSDVHLGSNVSRPEALLETLKRHSFRQLVLLGDILDDVDFHRLQRPHWNLLHYLRKLCLPDSGVKVVWVEGNHDRLLSRISRNFLGIDIHSRYQWTSQDRTFMAMHGHQFDTFIPRHPVVTETACSLYRAIQYLEGTSLHCRERTQFRISRFLKRRTKLWLEMSELIGQRALGYAKKRHVDHIFCGHTHQPFSSESGSIAYHNAGCWTDWPATFITIGDRGVELNECS